MTDDLAPKVPYGLFDAAGRMIMAGDIRRDLLAMLAKPGQRVLEGDFADGTTLDWGGRPVAPAATIAAPVTPEAVKAAAARRLRRTDWMAIRAIEGGTPVPPEVLEERARIRERSNAIEAMSPIPHDFDDARYWA